jgi:pimeloyl-ACP methyl ester carboxylesterase
MLMATTIRRLTILGLMIAIDAGVGRAETSTQPVGSTAPPSRPARFLTDDQIEIHGTYTPPATKEPAKAPIVILLHMYNKNRSGFDPLLPALHEAGFAVLAIDMRGHGESVGPAAMNLPKRVADRDPKLFREMYRDVQAAYLWLTGQPEADPARFALVGASVGGSVALDYAARDRSVDAVVCMTPGTNYLGIDSLRDARKYGRRPFLLLAAEPERSAADTLAGFVPGATLKIVPGRADDEMALHGTNMFGRVPGVEQIIVGFVLKAVGPPATQPVFASITSDVYHPPESPSVRRVKKENLRQFSSPTEAESRGLRPSKTASRKSTP